MLTTGEQRELRLIEEELQNTDREFAWRLTVVQGVLRWAAPGRHGCLLILVALAAALVPLAAAAERLLTELARGAVLMGPTILVFPGGTAWPGWESEQPPGHSVSQAQAGRSPAGQIRHEHTGKPDGCPGIPAPRRGSTGTSPAGASRPPAQTIATRTCRNSRTYRANRQHGRDSAVLAAPSCTPIPRAARRS